MGKGNGEHPPQKFVNDQCFCQLFIFVYMGGSVTLSSLSAGMDDGGSFPYPYFFTGFILGPILLVNLISRWYVVRTVQQKGLTRKNIVDILTTTTWGKHIWPWSCKIGMLWCIPGSIVTGLGGVNCGIEEKQDKASPTNVTRDVKNTCYFDIEGEHGDMYKGLATGLVVIHVLSFVYLLLSNCPVHSVLEQIKEDPRSNTRPAAASTAASAAAAANNRPAAASATGGAHNETEMQTTMQQLEARVRELENRERQIRELSVIAAPPSYSELMASSSYKNTGAHPDNSIV